jgi:phosphatidylserine decarboxylase precursor
MPVDDPIEEFQRLARKDKGFIALLEKSLKLADDAAQKQLDPLLYKALQWPLDLSTYVDYLTKFARWIPKQSTDPAWTKPSTDEHQEVYDRLCHFYWLIDQKVGPDGRIVENVPWFREWLVRYASAWGSFLNTTESFNHETLQSFIDLSPQYAVKDSMIGAPPHERPNEPSGWLTFNQFFARQLNPGLRPIASPTDNRVVTSPADCTYKGHYAIDADSNVISSDLNAKKIKLKKTHSVGNIRDLLQDSPYKDKFTNGTFTHYFLSPYSYHRFHMPVAGTVLECRPVQGQVYLDVNIPTEGPNKGQFYAPDSSEGGYQFMQSRGVVVVDTADSPFGDIGLVAIVPVGMAQVSSVNMTMAVGSDVLKGDEFGYFLFGGSDIIVVFQEHANAQVNTSTDYHHYGTKIAATAIRKAD